MKQRWYSLLSLLLLLCLTACGVRQAPLSGSFPAGSGPAVSSAADAAPGRAEAPDPASSGAASAEADLQAPGSSLPDESRPTDPPSNSPPAESGAAALPEEAGSYTTKEDVALYIHLYGHLPGNFITKAEAQALGWSGGSLEPYAPGKCIGGSRFGNYEGLLPEKDGRTYQECDIDTLGAKSRGAKRLVYSNDGLIYYTGDHYESFELLYGEE